MTRTKYALSLSLMIGSAAMGVPQMAAAQTITFTPGLYEYSAILNVFGQTMSEDTSEYCIVEGDNSRTLEALVDDLSGNAQCTLSNVSLTDTTGQADFVCQPESLGLEVLGRMNAEYSAEHLDINLNGTIGGFAPANVIATARRNGACPIEPATPSE